MVRRIISNHAPKPGCYVDADSFVAKKPYSPVGLNLLLVIPGLLAGASPVWFLYPYCYSGYLVSLSLHAFTTEGTAGTALQLFSFIPCALLIFLSTLFISSQSLWQTNRFTEIKIYDQSVDEIERKYLFLVTN